MEFFHTEVGLLLKALFLERCFEHQKYNSSLYWGGGSLSSNFPQKTSGNETDIIKLLP